MLTSRRAQAVLIAIGPTARVAHLGSVALTVGLAAAPALVTALQRDASASTPLLLVCLVGSAALGWAAEDPASDVLTPLPVPPLARAVLRVLIVAVVAATVVALSILVIALGPGVPEDRQSRIAEGAAAGAIALAVGLAASRRGERGTGALGVTAGVLGSALIAALAVRWPSRLPTFGPGPTHARWWLVAAAAALVAVRAVRDPGRS